MNKALIGGNGFQYDTATGEGYLNGQIQQGGNRSPNEMFGRYGHAPTQDANDPNAVSDNPYWERTTTAEDDAGHSTTSWRQNQAYNDYMTQHGLTGVSQLGQGGFREIKNPGDVTWDENFGLVTKPENMGAQDPASRNRAHMVRNLILLAGAGAAGAGALGAAEFGGAGAASTGAIEGGGLLNAADFVVPAADTTLTGAGAGTVAGGTGSAGGAMFGTPGFGGAAGYGAPISSGALGTGSGVGLEVGAGVSGGGGALGSGGSLVGTGLTGAGGSSGLAAGLVPTSGAIGAGSGNALIDAGRDYITRMGNGNMDWTDVARQLLSNQGQGQGQGSGNSSSAGGGLIGDIINAYLGSQNPSAMGEFNRNRGWSEDMMNQTTAANRPTQHTAFGDSNWVKDPQTGQWTQNVTLNPQDQARLDLNRQVQQRALEHARDYKPLDTSQFSHRSMGGSYLGF